MSVSQMLKTMIEERGITYTFIAAKTGISVDAISKSMMGKRKLHADEMVSICKAINVDLNDFKNRDLPLAQQPGE